MDSTVDTVTETFVSSSNDNLPKNWTKAQVRDFYARFAEKLPKGVTEQSLVEQVRPAPVTPLELTTEADGSEIYVSARSRRGFTLDSMVVVDTIPTSLRVLGASGRLRPVRTEYIDRTTVRPRKAVLYEAEFTDRPRTLVITPETYKALSPEYPQKDAKNEVLSPAQQKAVDQSHAKVMKADRGARRR